ncbi:hypothetical protein [Calothrix sp. UHCC 0171]|nr:hypothetical protein [Calothrix sp. UHCC 0171]MEA5570105.1 hypothetical protein [Calothrix sp. UHCC 0171]
MHKAFVTELIERWEDLVNAIAINSTMFNAARLISSFSYDKLKYSQST